MVAERYRLPEGAAPQPPSDRARRWVERLALRTDAARLLVYEAWRQGAYEGREQRADASYDSGYADGFRAASEGRALDGRGRARWDPGDLPRLARYGSQYGLVLGALAADPGAYVPIPTLLAACAKPDGALARHTLTVRIAELRLRLRGTGWTITPALGARYALVPAAAEAEYAPESDTAGLQGR